MGYAMPAEPVPAGHPSQDYSERFPEDVLLRQHGYKIHARPKHGKPAVWEKKGILFPHDEALLRIPEKEEVAE